MIHTDVLIVGGGPAGSACAWKLRQQGLRVLILDKAAFPRVKPCAGWLTPQVLRDLEIGPTDYPLGLTHFDRFQVSINNFRFNLHTNQYAIRRVEFDHWLLQRSCAEYAQHTVQGVDVTTGRYILDGEFTADYLVGAGGTHCPVKKTLFPAAAEGPNPSLIVAQEEEFQYEYKDPRCYLWFFQNGLPGYAWYVPKANGYVNVGVGGKAAELKARGDALKRHWRLLVEQLDRSGLIHNHDYRPVGHSYWLRGQNPAPRQGNAFLIGDAAGLATQDMGEGIGPAIRSGLRAAEAILSGHEYSLRSLPRYSFPALLGLRR